MIEGTEKKVLTAAQQKKNHRKQAAYVRAGIQIVFFFAAPALFTSAFSGIKYIFSQVSAGQPLAWNSFLKTLLALCAFSMVAGRFFCGYACAFGALGDGVYFLREKIRKTCGKKKFGLPERVTEKLRYLPYLLLGLIVLLCAVGVYGSISGWSPWDVFSMMTALNFQLRHYIPGVVLLILILAGMAVEERFFCRFLCPMGAIFRLLPIMPWARLRRDREHCPQNCNACTRNCPTRMKLEQNTGDCLRCGKCAGLCPTENISTGIHGIRGDEISIALLKGVLLAGMTVALGACRFL